MIAKTTSNTKPAALAAACAAVAEVTGFESANVGRLIYKGELHKVFAIYGVVFNHVDFGFSFSTQTEYAEVYHNYIYIIKDKMFITIKHINLDGVGIFLNTVEIEVTEYPCEDSTETIRDTELELRIASKIADYR